MNSPLRLAVFSILKRFGDTWQYRLRSVPGLMRLYYVVYRGVKPRGRVLTKDEDLRIYVNADDDVMAPEMLAYGVHEPYETELFKTLIKPSMVVVDIGANFGYYSLIAAKLVGEAGKVYAFEPEPNNYELLLANIAANCLSNVVPIQKAVSNKVGATGLFLDRGNWGAHTLSEDNIETELRGTIEVETTTLDAFFKNEMSIAVDIIKMDVQGAEGLVLEGAVEIIRQNNVKILMEFWPQGLRNLGTDPISLLKALRDQYSLSIQMVMKDDERYELKEIAKIVEVAEEKRYVNLILEKEAG